MNQTSADPTDITLEQARLMVSKAIEKAKEINVVINPHWLNIMNWQDHNNHLSIGEYGNKEKQWNKIKRQWNIDKFIADILKGHKEYYRNVVRF